MEGGDSCLKQNNRIGLLKYLKKKAKFKKKKNLHKIKINSKYTKDDQDLFLKVY